MPRILSVGQVSARIRPDASVATARVYIYRLIRLAQFPAPIQLSPGRIGWPEDVIEQWIASRPTVSYAPKVAA